MSTQTSVDDDEIAALMDELEAEIGAVAAPAPKVEAKTDLVLEPAPEPEPEPAPAPKPVAAKTKPAPKLEESLEDLESAMAELKAEEPKSPEIVVDVKKVMEAAAALPVVPVPEEPIDMGSPDADALSADVPKTSAKAQLQFFVDVNQFNRDTKLTEATLDQAMMEQAGLRAYYGSQAANAEGQHARLKVRFEVLEAKLYDEHRKTLAAGGEKVTEKMVENAVKLDPRWSKAKNTVIEAETIASVNKALSISLADRRDMMIQLGADRREEFKGAARVLAAQDERESMASRAAAAFQRGTGNH